jgi:hypothetical protein
MSYTIPMKSTRSVKGVSKMPHVYSLVLTVNKKGVYLYTGIHHSLDEAVTAAKKEAVESIKLPKGQKLQTDLDLWTTYDGIRAFDELATVKKKIEDPDTKVGLFLYNEDDCKIRIQNARNTLMQMLIKKKSLEMLDEYKNLLTPHQYRYVKDKVGR